MTAADLTAVAVVALALAWIVAIGGRRRSDADRLVIGVSLGVLAAGCNLVIPIPNVELLTVLVVASAVTLGARTALIVAAVGIVGSAVSGGLGPWTVWQVAALAMVAGCSRVVSAAGPLVWRRGVFAAVVLLGTALYDVVVTVSTLQLVGVTGNVVSALLLGLPYSLVHIAMNGAIALALGPVLLQALMRARERTNPPTNVVRG